MEAVRAFNNELSALYETKPPISRAKMAQLTKCAIKAIKFYKHVVQSVEKFIQKCKPEYKVPGLYVIDSVVRQSRHQFGSNKDVFAPRFTKNIITTFQNLFKCPGDERSKIVRVLNLWQKNDVFPSEIIQPLLDLAADPTKPSALAAAQAAVDRVVAASGKSSSSQSHAQSAPQEPAAPPISQAAAENMLATQNDMLNTVTQLLQQTDADNSSLSAQQQQLQQLQLLQQQLIQQTQLMQQPSGAPPIIDSNLLAQIQTLTNQLLSKKEPKADTGGSGFNTKLLDFDYGESDDEDERRHHHHQQQHQQHQQQGDPNISGNVQTILNDSSLMQQIHQMSQNIQKNEQLSSEISEQERRRRVLEQQQAEFDQQISQGAPGQMFPGQQPPMPDGSFREEGEYEEEPHDEDFRDHQQLRDRDDRDRRDRRRRDRDERSRSRTPKRRRRTRSRSRDRRRRSRSRDRYRRSRSKDREREKQKEKERERKKKALPPIRDNMLTVCSTTIWIGHLNKFTSEEELKAELEHYGPVGNISMVPPRGCAYVVMTHRKDAYKAIDRLKGYKLNGSALKTAWAQSQGIRDSEFKDSWDVEHGAIYIPWESLPPDLSPLLDGGIIDQDTLPDKLKDIPTEKSQLPEDQGQASVEVETSQSVQISMGQQPPLPGQPPLLGMMPGQQPGAMPGMAGMVPGMMMPMQRPLVPGMPPQPMPMPPGAPPQMLPTLRPPGAVNPALGGMSIANSVTSSLPQSIQNVLATTAGVAPNSPARAAFTPGAPPPRFGFNPNMPPPGFRLPPPGFGGPMRPMMPPGLGMSPNKPIEQPEHPPMEGPKQPEIAWPPDSNEKDEDEDEDSDGNKNEGNVFQSGQFAGMPTGPEHPSLLGPRPPGGFPPGAPPGPPNQPWNLPPGMQGMRRPQMGGMFNRPPLLGMGGPRGPRFMGNMPPGFPRFPPGGPNARGPVPLLELDLKPPEGFEGETFNDENDEENAENNDKEESQERDDGKATYPFNSWSSVEGNRDRDRSGDHDRSRRDRDNWDSRGRDRDRDWRDSRDRDRDRDRHRDRDNDKDWRSRRDRDRDRDRGDKDRDRSDRDRDRDRDRSRREDRPPRASRWSNVEEDVKPADQGDNSGNVSENVNTSDNMQNNPENSISEPEPSAGQEVAENTNVENTEDVSNQVSNTVSENENHTESVNNEASQNEERPSNDIQEEPVGQSEPSTEVDTAVPETNTTEAEMNTAEAEMVENEVPQEDVSEETGPVGNGPVIEDSAPNPPEELPTPPVKTVGAVEVTPVVETAPEKNGTELVQENTEDLEEGEIS